MNIPLGVYCNDLNQTMKEKIYSQNAIECYQLKNKLANGKEKI